MYVNPLQQGIRWNHISVICVIQNKVVKEVYKTDV